MPEPNAVSERSPIWLDLVITLWIVLVGVVYLGGYLDPRIGDLTGRAAVAYAGLIVLAGARAGLGLARPRRAAAEPAD